MIGAKMGRKIKRAPATTGGEHGAPCSVGTHSALIDKGYDPIELSFKRTPNRSGGTNQVCKSAARLRGYREVDILSA